MYMCVYKYIDYVTPCTYTGRRHDVEGRAAGSIVDIDIDIIIFNHYIIEIGLTRRDNLTITVT